MAGAMKALIQGTLRQFGYELRRYPNDAALPPASLRQIVDDRLGQLWVQHLTRTGPIEIVIDVGANDGDMVALFRAAFPASRIWAFEPSGVYSDLRARYAADVQTMPVYSAVGARNGETTLYEHRSARANSLLPDHRSIHAMAPAELIAPTGTRVVPITRLDTFCSEQQIARIDLLKIDVQGYEREVLRGAGRLLTPATIRGIVLEVLFMDAYEGQGWPGQLMEDLRGRGYRLFGMTNIVHDELHGWKWADALFIGA